jgi:hypothetical protein
MSTRIRAATAADIHAITAIYAHAVRFGTASFEIDPPDAAEMGERFAVLAAGGFPPPPTRGSPAMPMRGVTAPVSPTATRSRTASISTRNSIARASAALCSIGW